MNPDPRGRVRLDYSIPARGIIGFRTEFLTATSGTGIMYHCFGRIQALRFLRHRAAQNGVLVSMTGGTALGFALLNLQDRGRLFVEPGDQVFEGMIVGVHSRGKRPRRQPNKGQATNQYSRRGQ